MTHPKPSNDSNKTEDQNENLTFMAKVLSFFVHAYRKIISPLLPKCCRYTPTCSEYALEALKIHGAGLGSWLIFKRVLRCNPLGGSGFDPVPLKGQAEGMGIRHLIYFALFVFILSFGVFQAVKSVKRFEQKHGLALKQGEEKKYNLSVRFLRFIVRFYQANISGIMPGKCRFKPSCSAYGMEALEKHGAIKGSYLIIVRILKCQPWGPSGDDFVPDPR